MLVDVVGSGGEGGRRGGGDEAPRRIPDGGPPVRTLRIGPRMAKKWRGSSKGR